MSKEITVAILENDLFARNWMALLLVRDWRTRVVGEFSSFTDLSKHLETGKFWFDFLIVDVDQFGEHLKIREICQYLQSNLPKAKILLTGIQSNQRVLNQADYEQVAGYVLKNEVGYSLSWMMTFLSEECWVLTPGIQSLAHEINYRLPSNALVLEGRKAIPGFTDHEAEVARMAFIFSIGRRDLADELKISEQWSYGLVSELYKKMGLTEILAGETDLFSYIGESAIIKNKFKEIVEQLGSSKKAKDMETLAFHLLTMPEIVQ